MIMTKVARLVCSRKKPNRFLPKRENRVQTTALPPKTTTQHNNSQYLPTRRLSRSILIPFRVRLELRDQEAVLKIRLYRNPVSHLAILGVDRTRIGKSRARVAWARMVEASQSWIWTLPITEGTATTHHKIIRIKCPSHFFSKIRAKLRIRQTASKEEKKAGWLCKNGLRRAILLKVKVPMAFRDQTAKEACHRYSNIISRPNNCLEISSNKISWWLDSRQEIHPTHLPMQGSQLMRQWFLQAAPRSLYKEAPKLLAASIWAVPSWPSSNSNNSIKYN
jgi:hypothetical protein